MSNPGDASQSSTTSTESAPQSRGNMEAVTHSSPESSPILITSHRLNGHNFLQWSQSVMMFICGKGEDDYITGEAPMPTSLDPGYKKWKSENNMIMSWLINSMNNDIGENFLLFGTAKEIWDAARETYSGSKNTFELFQIESLLHDFRQGDQSVTQYFNTLIRHWRHLDLFETFPWKCTGDSALYRQIVEQKRTFKFLLGLNKDLDQVRGRVLGTKPLPSLREAFSEVRREESRKKVMMGQPESVMDASALAARGTPNIGTSESRRRGERPWCDHCRKVGHYKDNCWKIHGKPADWKPRQKADRDGRAHVAAAENPATIDALPFNKEQIQMLQQLFAQATVNPPNVSTGFAVQKNLPNHSVFHASIKNRSWIIDSGASDHMTGDASLFHEYKPSKGDCSVRIANGSHSKVNGTGPEFGEDDLQC